MEWYLKGGRYPSWASHPRLIPDLDMHAHTTRICYVYVITHSTRYTKKMLPTLFKNAMRIVKTLSLFFFFIYVYEFLVCKYVYDSLVCLVPLEARREYWCLRTGVTDSWICLVCFAWDTLSHYVALTILELSSRTDWPWTRRSSCHCLPTADIESLHHGHHMGAVNQTQDLLKEQPVLLTTEPSLQYNMALLIGRNIVCGRKQNREYSRAIQCFCI